MIMNMRDIQDTVDLLKKAEEESLRESLIQMKGLWKRYKQAAQKGEVVLAKKLRREYFEEAFINLALMASPLELLFPDPQLKRMMEKISHELEY